MSYLFKMLYIYIYNIIKYIFFNNRRIFFHNKKVYKSMIKICIIVNIPFSIIWHLNIYFFQFDVFKMDSCMKHAPKMFLDLMSIFWLSVRREKIILKGLRRSKPSFLWRGRGGRFRLSHVSSAPDPWYFLIDT